VVAGVIAATAVVAIRTAVASQQQPAPVAVSADGEAAMPASPEVEQTWGIRVTGVQLAAARGLALLRYQVLDNAKTVKLHAPDNSGIPEIWAEDAAGHLDTVTMGHRHYYGGGLVDGRTFALLYGNAHGALSPGMRVTIKFPDGLELAHVPVLT
jgi:hypothetical protein